MKIIKINDCSDCPYSKTNLKETIGENNRIVAVPYIVCDHYNLSNDIYVGNIKNIPNWCPLSDEIIDYNNIKESLASLSHDQWSNWMNYLFSKSIENEDGTVTIPKWAVNRWKRQVHTFYDQLSKEEQDSDRNEADKIIQILNNIFGTTNK